MNARATTDEVKKPTARDLAERHDMRIHRAKQLCRQVLHKGVKKWVAGFCHHDGDEEMVVYLKGSAEPVRPCDITIIEEAT